MKRRLGKLRVDHAKFCLREQLKDNNFPCLFVQVNNENAKLKKTVYIFTTRKYEDMKFKINYVICSKFYIHLFA